MEAQVKPLAAYKLQQAARTRFSFGPAWARNVLAGDVTDQAKMVAHCVKLKAGRKHDLSKLKFDTLLAKLQKALAQPAV